MKKILMSRTVWTIALMLSMNVVSSLTGILSPDMTILINSILSSIAVYFKINPSQNY